MSIVRAKKHLGQHFLKDQNIACKITASLLPVSKGVPEIGPGRGTESLVKKIRNYRAYSLTSTRESIVYLLEEATCLHKEADYYQYFTKIGYSRISARTFFWNHQESCLITSLHKSFFFHLERAGSNPPVVCTDTKGSRTYRCLSAGQDMQVLSVFLQNIFTTSQYLFLRWGEQVSIHHQK